MSEPRFYLDADSSDWDVVRPLRADLIDLETATEAGLRTADDEEQIAHVLASQRIIITGDHALRDRFIQITREGGHHPGMLFLPGMRRNEIGAIIESMKLVHEVCSAEEMVDQVQFIPF